MVESMNTDEDLSGGGATKNHRLTDSEHSPPPKARDSPEQDPQKPIRPDSPSSSPHPPHRRYRGRDGNGPESPSPSPPPPRQRPNGGPDALSSSPPPPRPRSRGRERDSRERPIERPENSGDSPPPRRTRSRDWPIGPGEREFDRPGGPLQPRSRSRGRERDSREREFGRPNGPGGGGGGGGRERDFREREFDRPMRRDFYRDREYNKRSRNSFSPPPPPYRQRRGGGGGGGRYSPPRRRSPPFNDYKRRRGDNGGYVRRGSPRGGFAGGNRRFYNDYPDEYDHEMDSRHDYPEERHGRNMGRSSGGYRASFDTGRFGGQADAFNAGRPKREGLMSYKQFIQELEDEVLPSEAEHRYKEYRTEYISTQKKAYFDAHKDEEWLKDKYHPTNLVAVIERRNELARKQAKDFQLDLQSGVLDLGPSVTASSSNKSGQPNDHGSDGEEGGKRNRHGRGSAKDEDLFSAAPKAHPVSSESRRIQIDVEQAQALVRKLDSEKGIEDNILCRSDGDRGGRDKSHGASSGPVIIIRGLTSVKGLEGIELLDTLLTYLWRIHGLDYYGSTETNGAKGLRHMRVDGKTSDSTVNGAEWEKKLDSCWKDRLKVQDPLEIMAAKEKIDAAANEGLDPYVRKIRDEKYGWKYGCGAKGCTKLFHAAEFVHKHLKLKHQDLMMELTSKVREDLYFQNYMNDESAPGGTPVMQQPTLKERLQKRRLGPDNRMEDERARREHEYRSNGAEGFDGSGDDNADEAMFDAFAGQGIHMAHFPSDIPPPVLMPVPGAGPLGPFVPAPPEVAMRMMREQGGPSPFEGGGINGISGPQLSGPAPIMALPPPFREDPRRLRSYQDLDGPEDEVTVIDYRSL